MKITIGYITARDEPCLEWLIDDLEQQVQPDDQIELIVIDALGRPAKAIGFRPIKAIGKLVETKPKPTIWQGAHRITAHDFFANANARNTAIVLCSTDYLCFLDDRCRLDPTWLAVVRRGAEQRHSVICGPVDKHDDQGCFVDHRRQREPAGLKGAPPEWCYGANFALPLAWALDVNGFEEGCDPVGLEDCVLGHMLGNSGRRVDFDIGLSVQQDRRGYLHPAAFPRQDKGVAPEDKSHVMMQRFRSRRRTEFTPNLTAIRQVIASGGSFPRPDPTADYHDWFDGIAIRGLAMAPEEREARARSRE